MIVYELANNRSLVTRIFNRRLFTFLCEIFKMPRLKKKSMNMKNKEKKASRMNQTKDEMVKRREETRRRMAIHRAAETAEQTNKRRSENAARLANKRHNQTAKIQYRSTETAEQKMKRRAENARLLAKQRAAETVEQTNKRRSENAARLANKRRQERPFQRHCRLLKAARTQAKRRWLCTTEERRHQSILRSIRRLRLCTTSPVRALFSRPRPVEGSTLETVFEATMSTVQWQTCPLCQRSVLCQNKKSCGRRCDQFTAANDMDPGPVPEELSSLTYLEQQLVARVHPVVSVYRIRGHQLGYSGNVISFPQAVDEFAAVLPHRITSLSAVIVVRMKDSAANYVDFHVRASKVKRALVWLKTNNPYYCDVTISDENLSLLPEDGDAMQILPSFQDDDITVQDGQEDQESFENQVTVTGVPIMRTPHQENQVAAVLDWPAISSNPIDEFSTPGYISQAFPTLFPTGKADLSSPREHHVSPAEYFKHLILFKDHRFANDPRFRFFALNSVMRWSALRSGNLFVRRHEELHGKSVKELRELLNRDSSLLKKIMFYGNKLRGTRPYWRARLGELLDMEAQLGLPTVFLTLSAADLHWPDLFRILCDDDTELTEQERRRLVADEPLTPSSFFFERTEYFLDKILHKQLGVKDFWRRYEWQHRGSPHVHMLLWLSNAPDVTRLPHMTDEEVNQVVRYFDELICTMNPGLHTPPADIHPCRKSLSEVEDRDLDLAELVNKVQRHTKCSKSYCLRKNKTTGQLECRYKFPFDLSDHSYIRQNDKGLLELVTKRNDPLVNKFNAWILQIWRANMDITAILSKEAFLNYIAKYASKAEVKSKPMAEIFKNIMSTLSDTEPARKAVQKLLVQTCSERDFSSQEVLHLATGKKLFAASRAFVKLNFGADDWVPVGRRRDESTNELENDVQGDDENSKSTLLEKYRKRPPALEVVTLWEAASGFVPKKQGPWSRRRVPAVVSIFPRRKISTVPALREAYFRQQVLLRVPWRIEIDAKGNFQTWEEAFNRYSLQGNVLVDIPRLDEDEYEEIPPSHEAIPGDEWIVVAGKLPNAGVGQVEPGRREIDIQHKWNEESEVFGDAGFLRRFLETSKRQNGDRFPEHPTTPVELNAEQRQVLDILDEQIAAEQSGSTVDAAQLVIIQGKAGCGKSTVIKAMTSRLNEAPGLGSDSYLLLAPTGSAALNINGNTIHAALSIPVRTTEYRPLEGAVKKRFLDDMEKVRFLIIDEYSMIGLSLLGMIEQRCAEANPRNHSQVFGGIRIFLIGDIRQLPPVASKPLYSTSARTDLEIKGAFAVSQFRRAVVLNQSMRQTDSTFRQALDEVGRGCCTTATYAIFSSRFKSNLSEDERCLFNDATHIFSLRMTARVFNLRRLLGLHCPVARIPAKHNNETARQGTSDDAGGLQPVMYLAEGARVVLKANLWVAFGLVNGAVGVVVSIIYDSGKCTPDDLPVAVMVNFAKYTGPRLQRESVPITPITRVWRKGSATCVREQIPLDLAWASTVHQSQGQTYDRVVVDLGLKEYQIGLSYVALSRCKTLEGLAISPAFTRQRLDHLKWKKSLKDKLQAEGNILKISQGLPVTLSGFVPSSIPPNPKPAPSPPHLPVSSPPRPSAALRVEAVRVHEGEVTVAVMPGDGHCLFSALLHQLGLSVPGSPDHLDAVKKLRSRVVAYIRQQDLHSGLWREQLEDSISANEARYPAVRNGMQATWQDRLEEFLTNLEDDEWGGTETIASVAAIDDVVVTTYFEDGGDGFGCQRATPESGGSKEIAVVYRLGVVSGDDAPVSRVHYDSFLRFN